jgi:glycosyltransferase involved in cell wall biosynthesis
MASDPLVSCLMVTLGSPGRTPLLRKAIAAYCAQTHAKRELVIVLDPGTAQARTTVAAEVDPLGRDDIRIIEADGPATLGALRNFARAAARGEVHCQWDDDDLHHPTRIEAQLAALAGSGAEGACLSEVMQYFPATRALYCTNWSATPHRCHPGTLMCRAEMALDYPETGPKARMGEDSVLLDRLQARGGLHILAGQPHLYVYVTHGANTWDDGHHSMLARRLAISQGLLRRREAQLREGLAAFDFGPDEVTVQGPNGPAFSL